MAKILMATDGSEHAVKVADAAILLANALGAEISVITVTPVSHMAPDLVALYQEQMEQGAREILEEAKSYFAARGLEVETIHKVGHPASVICETAEKGGFDLIVLGSRGLGKIKELLLGSVSNRVAHNARTSVYIVK